MEDKIKKLQAILNISYKEALQIIEDDKKIDSGGRCDWEVSEEEEREIRKRSKINIHKKKMKEVK